MQVQNMFKTTGKHGILYLTQVLHSEGQVTKGGQSDCVEGESKNWMLRQPVSKKHPVSPKEFRKD